MVIQKKIVIQLECDLVIKSLFETKKNKLFHFAFGYI